ncbi:MULTISPECIES: hypothetical protein [Halorussus]|uniref:DUF7344 domain-containing protein n=1 Tax=Halorussus TaxID=1070314 RepID=UPI000E20EE42|nr:MULTISPECIES: hypothetical protein [Halorussus]NHN59074.1 hypothetical protein [Halorussus sp. JP-T4]
MSKYDEAAAASLTTDQTLELLADGRRRNAVAALRETDGAATLGELAAATAARLDDVDRPAVPTDRRERVAASLHHSHLPKLADAGVVEYDPGESRVVLTETAAELEPYFEVIERRFSE